MHHPIFSASLSLSQRPRDPDEECRLLRTALSDALRTQRMEAAAAFLERLELADPESPRWAHQHGDTLVLLGEADSAKVALGRAAKLYFQQGLVKQQQVLLERLHDLDATKRDHE